MMTTQMIEVDRCTGFGMAIGQDMRIVISWIKVKERIIVGMTTTMITEGTMTTMTEGIVVTNMSVITPHARIEMSTSVQRFSTS